MEYQKPHTICGFFCVFFLLSLQVKQIHIDYTRNAKRLDVKKLKANMWGIITEHTEDMKENVVCD